MEADGRWLAGFGVCLAAACALTGLVAFVQIGIGAHDEAEAAVAGAGEQLDGTGAAAAGQPAVTREIDPLR